MAINPLCDICGQELKDYGAIILGPPEGHKVDKFHVCTKCYKPIREILKPRSQTEAKITTDKPKS